MTDDPIRIMLSQDRPRLRGHSQAGQVDDDRIPETDVKAAAVVGFH